MSHELKIIEFHIDGTDYYGGNQEWFESSWARKAGCASVLAANLYCYFAKRNMDYEHYRELMDEMFSVFTPGVMGFPFFRKFITYFLNYMSTHGYVLEAEIYGKASRTDGFTFVTSCIDQDWPIGLLVLTHRHPDIQEETWHWMMITGYTDKKEVIVSSCGEKMTIPADILFDPHPMNMVRMVSFHKR